MVLLPAKLGYKCKGIAGNIPQTHYGNSNTNLPHNPNIKGKGKIHKVMSEYKHGKLKSSSGHKVKNQKQAVAIALSEARQAGAKIPNK